MPEMNVVLSLVEADITKGAFSSAMMKLVSISNECSKNLKFLNLLAITQNGLNDNLGRCKTLFAIAQITDAVDVYLNLLDGFYAVGNLHEALDVALLIENRNLTNQQILRVSEVLAKIYIEFSDFEGIEELANQLNLKKVESDQVLFAAGLSRLHFEDREGAIFNFRRAVEINSANDQAWVSLAMLHDDMGDRELASANLENALDCNTENATALKLMAKWHGQEKSQVERVISKVCHYLAQHEFDEEISLCYLQILKDNAQWQQAQFEIDKLILNNPTNANFYKLKKNLQELTIL